MRDLIKVPIKLMFRSNTLVLEEKIGEGSFGAVFRGYLNRGLEGRVPVAFKRITIDDAFTPQDKAKVENELELMCAVEHPNVAKVLCVCGNPGALDQRGQPLGVGIVLELAPHGSLFKVLRDRVNHAELTWPLRTRLLLHTATAMRALHEHKPRGIIHRDLKSLNVLVFGGGQRDLMAKITDFGLAETLSSTATARTRAGSQG